jgi:hypothetical protein
VRSSERHRHSHRNDGPVRSSRRRFPSPSCCFLAVLVFPITLQLLRCPSPKTTKRRFAALAPGFRPNVSSEWTPFVACRLVCCLLGCIRARALAGPLVLWNK